MRWVVLNPNTSSAMTDAVVAELRRFAPADTTVLGLTADEGCAVIDSCETFDIGALTALAMCARLPADTDAVLLACFGDPGLEALRGHLRIPVVGLAEAALHHADASGETFAIVTAGANWVGLLRGRADDFSVGRRLVGVYAMAANGADLRRDPAAFLAQVHALSSRAADDGARMLVLGGAAFAGLDFDIDERLSLIDAIRVACNALREACRARPVVKRVS